MKEENFFILYDLSPLQIEVFPYFFESKDFGEM
jgi:hypothetical protein